MSKLIKLRILRVYREQGEEVARKFVKIYCKSGMKAALDYLGGN